MQSNEPDRRRFLKTLAMSGAAAAALPRFPGILHAANDPTGPPATNIDDALAVPRVATSMPGLYPGRVVEVHDEHCIVDDSPDTTAAKRMLEHAMMELTGSTTLADAWLRFVTPNDIIGLKVNPVAGTLLSTSLAIVNAVISQLEEAGIPREHIVIWDRREFQLHEVGFTSDNFPGIRIWGTECKDAANSFRDANGELYSLQRIDKDVFYWADCEETYDDETLPYMVNEGKYSYFAALLTNELTKVINIPILKNAGNSITLCLKNLAYGAITNTARLHKQLWAETSAQVPCFVPLRDKTVLNIVDGIIGCYNGGPAANPQFIIPYHCLLVGSDPVAVDRIGYDIVLKKRIEKEIQKQESPRALAFMNMAEQYGLGIADPSRIDHVVSLSQD